MFWNYGQENFLDPGPPLNLGFDSQVWYYCFYPTNPFVQHGTLSQSNRYWLAAYTQLPAGYTNKYGWKTTTYVQYDISVHAPWPGVPPVINPGWTPTYTDLGYPLDLAFKLTTPVTNRPPPVILITHTNIGVVFSLVITWNGGGILQSATTVVGPWINVTGATSPYVAPMDVPSRFYRVLLP